MLPRDKKKKKIRKNRENLTLKKNDFPNRQDLMESLFFCSQKKKYER